MIYEIRAYTIRPGKMEEFLAFFNREGSSIGGTIKTHGQLIGHWQTVRRFLVDVVGTEFKEEDQKEASNEVVYMLAFKDMAQRTEFWKSFGNDKRWQKERPTFTSLVSKMDIKILNPTKVSPLK
ncbi:MAG: NIPSNAP family protein [Candidatus Freyarchaeum deiterrae]